MVLAKKNCKLTLKFKNENPKFKIFKNQAKLVI